MTYAFIFHIDQTNIAAISFSDGFPSLLVTWKTFIFKKNIFKLLYIQIHFLQSDSNPSDSALIFIKFQAL